MRSPGATAPSSSCQSVPATGRGCRWCYRYKSRDATEVSEAELAFLVTVTHLGAIAVEKAKRLEAQRAQTERLRRALAVNESLLGHALAGNSLAALVRVVETLLTEPLVVVDLITQTLLARHSPAPDLIAGLNGAASCARGPPGC